PSIFLAQIDGPFFKNVRCEVINIHDSVVYSAGWQRRGWQKWRSNRGRSIDGTAGMFPKRCGGLPPQIFIVVSGLVRSQYSI
ncbi:MAG: hypothetical protein ABGY21_06910, partial [Pseudomonadota bacterium]